jgi:hypothetical protein
MGLMQLLTVGRSWSEVKNQPHRYKLRTDGWPTFGYETPPTWQRTSGSRGQKVETAMKTETMAMNSDVMQAFPRGRWTLGAKPAPRAGRATAAIQGELSLDRVKPVRNDLTDADLELAPAKPAVKTPEPANVFAAPQPAVASAAKASWLNRLTGRLFRRKVM